MHTHPSINDLQKELAAHLQFPPHLCAEEFEKNELSWIKQGPHLTPQERLKIYHRQVWYRLDRALQSQYPSLFNLLGKTAFFDEIGHPFLLTYWPTDWALPHLGKNLPLWLKKSYAKENKKLLIGLAKVDWAFHQLRYKKRVLIYIENDFFLWRQNLFNREQNKLPIPSGFKRWRLLRS